MDCRYDGVTRLPMEDPHLRIVGIPGLSCCEILQIEPWNPMMPLRPRRWCLVAHAFGWHDLLPRGSFASSQAPNAKPPIEDSCRATIAAPQWASKPPQPAQFASRVARYQLQWACATPRMIRHVIHSHSLVLNCLAARTDVRAGSMDMAPSSVGADVRSGDVGRAHTELSGCESS